MTIEYRQATNTSEAQMADSEHTGPTTVVLRTGGLHRQPKRTSWKNLCEKGRGLVGLNGLHSRAKEIGLDSVLADVLSSKNC